MNTENEIKTGAVQIADERLTQIEKGKTSAHDYDFNNMQQLALAGSMLSMPDMEREHNDEFIAGLCPNGWDPYYWIKLWKLPYKRRLVIAGALLAAEIDRVDLALKNQLKKTDDRSLGSYKEEE